MSHHWWPVHLQKFKQASVGEYLVEVLIAAFVMEELTELGHALTSIVTGWIVVVVVAVDDFVSDDCNVDDDDSLDEVVDELLSGTDEVEWIEVDKDTVIGIVSTFSVSISVTPCVCGTIDEIGFVGTAHN